LKLKNQNQSILRTLKFSEDMNQMLKLTKDILENLEQAFQEKLDLNSIQLLPIFSETLIDMDPLRLKQSIIWEIFKLQISVFKVF